jgi:SAM-dependent methyltransferase
MNNENNFMEKIFNVPTLYALKIKTITRIFNSIRFLWWKNYFDSVKLLHEKIIEKKRAKVFEIGSGSGFIYKTILKNDIEVNYSGTDLNKSMIDYCNIKFPEVSWYHFDKIPYKFEDNEFDIVVIWYVLHHVDTDENVTKMLSEASRIGRKVILVEAVQSFNYPLKILKNLYWKITDGGRYYFTVKELKNIFTRINCKVDLINVSEPLNQIAYIEFSKKNKDIL